MKYELTVDQLIEIAQCISHNELNADEACDYIMAVADEMNGVEYVEWPTEERIDAIGQNGNEGLHYD